MFNELWLLVHIGLMSAATIGALFFGKEALVTFVCLASVLANVFVLKQITLFGLNATAADAFAVSATLGLNLLQEYFGAPIARKAIWINFYFLVIYALFSQLHLAYLPAVFDRMQPHYYAILGIMPRIVIASFIAYFVAQTSDYLIYGLLRRTWHKRFLVVRNYISIIVSQLIDTVTFTYLGLYGIIENPLQIIVVSYSIKLLVIAMATPVVSVLGYLIKKKDLKT